MTAMPHIRRASRTPPRRAACALLAVLALAATGACASAQVRLQRGLLEAGVPPDRSECMARHMARQLSTSQLRRVGRLGRLNREHLEADGLERFLANAQALGDPRIVAVASASALGCAMIEP